LSKFAPYAGLPGVVAIGPIVAANALIELKLSLVASIDADMHQKVTDKGCS
jgi:hypothetical protein